MGSGFIKHLIKDTLIGVPLAILISWAIIHFEVFQLWYERVKSQELFILFFDRDPNAYNWSLNDTLSIIISLLLVGTILAVRHIFVFHKTMKEMDKLTKTLNKELRLKKQRQKLEALGEMSGGLAHEINNALQPITGYAEVMEATYKSDPKINKYVKAILKNTTHAKNIVGTVLTFSRRDPNVVHSITDIYELLKEAFEFINETLPKGVDINTAKVFDRETAPLHVQFDKTAFIQVLSNLVNNSVHAMNNKGTISVALSSQTIDEIYCQDLELKAGKYAVLSVTDTGHGMCEKTLELLFTPFFTTKEEGEGTGLGLSIVYGIIQGAEGNITVSSEVEKGTTFTIYLPVL